MNKKYAHASVFQCYVSNFSLCCILYTFSCIQWRSEGIWYPGANLNFAPSPPPTPLKKILKNDNKMSSIQLIMCIIISA